jgi:uncharacterized protein (TIGR02302 family)
MAGEALPSKLRWRLPLAWGAIVWERLWPALWPLVALALSFLSIALFDLLPGLPGWLHLGILVLFGLGAVAALVLAVRRFSWPDRKTALRRLERDSGFEHRPLTQLDDRFAGDASDAFGRLVWQAHRERLAASVGRIVLAGPKASLVHADPRALRVLLTLVLLIALVSAGGDAGQLLARAVAPRFDSGAPAEAPTIDLWLTPPAYTGLPPVYLDGHMPAAGPVAVPAGSTVLAEIHLAEGSDAGRPSLSLDDKNQAFQPLDADDFKAGLTLRRNGRLRISLGDRAVATYDVRVIPDRPPTAFWRGPVSATPHGALRVDYGAADDYGVAGLRLEIRSDLPGSAPLDLDLAVPVPAEKRVTDTIFRDLTADPRAGLPVTMRLVATDAAGQTGASPILRAVLPERQFHDPVARAIIQLRKRLTVAPGDAGIVAQGLSDISVRPDLFHDDLVVFLGLRIAARDLIAGTDAATIARVQALLWSIATRIEDGAAAGAEADLRAAQQALQDALARGASNAELEKRMQDVQQALQRYLQAMMSQQGPDTAQAPQDNGPTRTVTEQDIEKMLQRAEELARTGDREGARRAFQQLQALLESLQTGRAGGSAAAGQQALQAMGQIARKQQDLLDRSQTMNQQPGSAGAVAQGAEAAGEQEALRRQLDGLRNGPGGSQALDAAEQAMGQAAKALRRGDAGGAMAAQGQALSALRQAAQSLEQSMSQAEGPGGNGNQDPFGRNLNDAHDIDIANPAALQESRRILDELRRRAGDGERPQDERNYIERLLRDF